jgi:hypothetical protein
MTKVVTTRSVVYGVPAVTEQGKPVYDTATFKGRDHKYQVHDRVAHAAGEIIDVSPAVAAELLAAGAAREYERALDFVDASPPKVGGEDSLKAEGEDALS